jgi:hypothetical protein
VYWRPAERLRTFLQLAGSEEREGSKREATVGLYQDYLRLPRVFFRAGYVFIFSTRDASYRESRGVAEANVTVANWRRLRLVNRPRLEPRWANGCPDGRIPRTAEQPSLDSAAVRECTRDHDEAVLLMFIVARELCKMAGPCHTLAESRALTP